MLITMLITLLRAHDSTCYDRFERANRSYLDRPYLFASRGYAVSNGINGCKNRFLTSSFTRIIPSFNSLFFGPICSVHVKWLVYLALALSNDASATNLRDVLRKALWDFVTGMKEWMRGYEVVSGVGVIFFFFLIIERERQV